MSAISLVICYISIIYANLFPANLQARCTNFLTYNKLVDCIAQHVNQRPLLLPSFGFNHMSIAEWLLLGRGAGEIWRYIMLFRNLHCFDGRISGRVGIMMCLHLWCVASRGEWRLSAALARGGALQSWFGFRFFLSVSSDRHAALAPAPYYITWGVVLHHGASPQLK